MENSALGIIGMGFENKDVKEIIVAYEEMIKILGEESVKDMDFERLVYSLQLQSLYKKTVELLKKLDAMLTMENENCQKNQGIKAKE